MGDQAWVMRLAGALDAQVVETHISWVLLTARLAYKIKKPLRLAFLDYSTAQLRRHFCEQEVRLNARLAARLYLGVSRISGTPEAPEIDGAGPTLDWAVRMKRFPPGALISERLHAGTLATAEVDRFALRLAEFHATAPAASTGVDPDGAQPLRRARAALAGAQPLMSAEEAAALDAWLGAEWEQVRAIWVRRLRDGRVRDGHGDLHLANVVALDGDVAAFDCLEFDDTLRQLDVVDDAAFALMDFEARGRPDLGWRFINAWLEHTGEYEGVALLRFYLVARALVRAQVEHLRAAASTAALAYAGAALRWSRPGRPRLLITFGLPGSGKTFASQRLLQTEHAVRIRSDVERKRLFGLPALADTRAQGVDAYTEAATQATYARLLALAEIVLRAGFPAVLDAAFLRRPERTGAQELAQRLGIPFAILVCAAPHELLHHRLRTRSADASEADGRVLERLRDRAEALTAQEQHWAIQPSGGDAPAS